MFLTIESLLQHAENLTKQFEAASNMVQQTAGALSFVKTQVMVLQKLQEEEAKRLAQPHNPDEGQPQ